MSSRDSKRRCLATALDNGVILSEFVLESLGHIDCQTEYDKNRFWYAERAEICVIGAAATVVVPGTDAHRNALPFSCFH